MIASVRNLRLVSADRPIGLQQTPGPGARVTRSSFPERTIVPRRAAWKANPEWVSAIAEHTRLVNLLKSETDAIAKEQLLVELRTLESSMKPLKQRLMGFRKDA